MGAHGRQARGRLVRGATERAVLTGRPAMKALTLIMGVRTRTLSRFDRVTILSTCLMQLGCTHYKFPEVKFTLALPWCKAVLHQVLCRVVVFCMCSVSRAKEGVVFAWRTAC